MRVSRVWRTSVLAVGVLLAGQLAPLSAAHAAPPLPYAQVNSPMDGDTVARGLITVSVEGHTDPLSVTDSINSLTLMDGPTQVGATSDCSGNVDDQFNCTRTITWDTSVAAAGNHSLTVVMQSAGETTPSPANTVTVPAVVVPPPTVNITSPNNGGSHTGIVHVAATGTIDPSSTETAQTLQLERGATVVDTFACSATSKTCTAPDLQWDSTRANGSVQLKVVFTTSANSVQDTVNFTANNPGPMVHIQAPSSNAGVQGVVVVTAQGTITAGESDTPTKMELFLGNGSTVLDSQACTSSPCDASLSWDASGRSGPFTLRVVFTTADGSDSDTVRVNVTSPGPTAVITSPLAGATVSGVVLVTTDGEVNASQVDTAGTMQLFVDGSALGGPVDCPGTTRSCVVPFSWDASALLGPHKLHLKFVTANGVQIITPDETVNVVIVPPTATLSAPAAGATVSGVVPVTAAGVTDSRQSDTPSTLQLLIDGAAVGTPTACPAAVHTCLLPSSWDATGASGAHTLQSRMVTVKGVVALSAVVTVSVVSPAPTAVITSPTGGSTVARTVTVFVSGSVDPTQTDVPASMTLTIDGKPLGAAQPCASVPTSPRSCQVSFAWNSVGLTGGHVLVATLTTLHGAVGSSAATTVYVYGGTVVALPKLHTLRAGRSVTITGRATYLINKAGVSGVPVKILLVFANGKTRAFTVATNVNGFYKVTFVPTMNTVVEATVVPLAYNGTSHTFTRLAVIPQPTCTLKSKIARNTTAKGVCKLPGMPKGTKLKLQYEVKGKWYTLGTGRAPGTKVPFVYGFKVAGTYHVRLVFAASHVFVATIGPSLKVVVR